MKRTCRKCMSDLTLEDFPRSARSSEGRAWTCKACTEERRRARRAEIRDEVNSKNRAYRAAHPEKVADWQRKYREANLDVVRRRSREHSRSKYWAEEGRLEDAIERIKLRYWKDSNPELVNAEKAEKYREWRLANPERNRAKAAAYRSRTLGCDTYVIAARDLKRIASSPCALCGSPENVQIDHIIPLARGGRHSIGNLQPLCARHNAGKKDSLWIEYRVKAAA